jgi:hypothetical protein
MANQKVVKIVNVKRSISAEKRFEQNMMLSLWEQKEDELRGRGWLPASEIKEIKTEKVEDGKGKKTIDIVEEKEYSEMTLDELKAECKSQGIKFHGASKEEKLIELLTEEK